MEVSQGFTEVAQYLRARTEEKHPVRIILQCACGCRETAFRLEADPDEGCAQRTCHNCGAAVLLCNSDQVWDQSEPASQVCACGNDLHDVAVGFSYGANDEVSWITVGRRCIRCGALGTVADWAVDEQGTDYLLERT